MIWILLACTDPSGTNASSDSPWVQTWADEFNGTGAIDGDKWTHDLGGDGWGNNQLEFNTDRTENSRQEDGFLVIEARKEDYQGNTWTSARITTSETFAQQEGRFEAKIQLPPGAGIWPAFWMLGDNFQDVGWPNCGEIDIMEARGQDPTTTNAALHNPGGSGGDATYDSLTVTEDLQDGTHLYAVEWDDDHIAWFLDEQLVMTAHPGSINGGWVYDHPFFMILNVAVGGNYVGAPDESTPDSSKMYLDYVRVYERQP